MIMYLVSIIQLIWSCAKLVKEPIVSIFDVRCSTGRVVYPLFIALYYLTSCYCIIYLNRPFICLNLILKMLLDQSKNYLTSFYSFKKALGSKDEYKFSKIWHTQSKLVSIFFFTLSLFHSIHDTWQIFIVHGIELVEAFSQTCFFIVGEAILITGSDTSVFAYLSTAYQDLLHRTLEGLTSLSVSMTWHSYHK